MKVKDLIAILSTVDPEANVEGFAGQSLGPLNVVECYMAESDPPHPEICVLQLSDDGGAS